MSQQGQGGKELLFAIAVPREQQQFHKGTLLCKIPRLKVLRTQEKVSSIRSEPQQQETVRAALVPLSIMSCQVLHSPVQHLLDSPLKKTSLPFTLAQLLLFSKLLRTLYGVGLPPSHCSLSL